MNLDHRNTTLWAGVLYACAAGTVACFVVNSFMQSVPRVVSSGVGVLFMLGCTGASVMLKRAGKWK